MGLNSHIFLLAARTRSIQLFVVLVFKILFESFLLLLLLFEAGWATIVGSMVFFRWLSWNRRKTRRVMYNNQNSELKHVKFDFFVWKHQQKSIHRSKNEEFTSHMPIDSVDFHEIQSNTLNGKMGVYLIWYLHLNRLAISLFNKVKLDDLWPLDGSLKAHLLIYTQYLFERERESLSPTNCIETQSIFAIYSGIKLNAFNAYFTKSDQHHHHRIITANKIPLFSLENCVFWFHLHFMHLVWLKHFLHVWKLRCLHSVCCWIRSRARQAFAV